MNKEFGKTHKDLLAWSKSMDLASEIYETTKAWPSDEKYGRIEMRGKVGV